MKKTIRKYLTYGALYIGLLFLLIAAFFYILNYDIALTSIIFWFFFWWGIIFFPAGLIDWYNYYYKPQKELEAKKQKMENVTEEAIRTLKTRYVKGEISKEEYEQMKKDIEG